MLRFHSSFHSSFDNFWDFILFVNSHRIQGTGFKSWGEGGGTTWEAEARCLLKLFLNWETFLAKSRLRFYPPTKAISGRRILHAQYVGKSERFTYYVFLTFHERLLWFQATRHLQDHNLVVHSKNFSQHLMKNKFSTTSLGICEGLVLWMLTEKFIEDSSGFSKKFQLKEKIYIN